MRTRISTGISLQVTWLVTRLHKRRLDRCVIKLGVGAGVGALLGAAPLPHPSSDWLCVSSNAGTCTPTECCKREATMGFLTIFYKYIIQQYFTITAPTAFTKYLKQIKYKMLVLVHPQSAANVRLRWGF